MYIYINNQGKITTQIEHGVPVRQGNRLRLVVCFSLDNETATNASGLGAKFRLIDKSEEWSMEYDFPNPHINEFEKLKSSEIVYDLVPGEHYLMFEKIFDVNEFTTLYHGELQCILTLRQQNGLEYSGYIQDRLEINVAKTYGSYIPVPEITKDEYEALMESILSKLDHTDGNANRLTVNNGIYFGVQEFRNTNVFIKDAESDYEPTSLQQVVGLINTNNETVIEDKLSEKVDKISGKDLSTNDFTNQYKQKLDRLENYDDTDLKNRIFAVETENTAQGLDISNLESDVSLNKSSLNSLNNEFKIAKQDIVDIKSKNNAQDTEISSIKAKNTEQDNAISNINRINTEQDTEIYNIKIKNNTQDIEINSIRESLTDVSEELEDVKKTVADMEEIVENVENSVSGYDSLIENLEQNVSNYDNRITSLENTNKSQDTEISNIKSKNTSQDSEISSIKSKNTSQDTEISNNKKNIATNTNNISNIQSSITDLTSKNASQDNEINTLKGNVSTNTNALKNKADLVNGKIPSSQLPSFVDDVLEYSNKSSFPSTGETGKIYIDLANNTTYRWSGSTYVAIGSSLTLGETSSTAYPGNKGKELADSVANINNKNNSQDTEITNIKSSISTINAKDTAQDTRLTNLEDNYENISASVGTNRTDINNLINDLSGIDDTVKTHDETINGLNDSVNNNSTKNQEQDTRLTNLETDLEELTNKYDTNIANLEELTSKHDTHIADLEGVTSKHATNIADLEGVVTTIQQSDVEQNQSIQTVINQFGQVSENLYLLDSDVKDLTERTDIIEEDINNIKTEIDKIDEIDAKTNDLERNKADRLSGQIINDKFYTRVTATDSTNSKYEIIEDMGSIQKIGGMSYKSENLSPQSSTVPLSTGYFNTTQGAFGYIEKGKTYTFSAYYISSSVASINLGLRAMSNSDGTGTNLGNLQSIALTSGKRTSATFTASYSGYIGLTGSNFGATDTLSDITLNKGSTDLGYTPYFSGLRDTKVVALSSTGDNLLVFGDISTTAFYGVNYSVTNGEIKVSGTANTNGTFFIPITQYQMANAHYLKLFKSGTFGTTNHYFTLRTTDNQTLTTINLVSGNNATYTATTSVTLNRIAISIVNGQTYDFTIKPMLVSGSTAPNEFEQGWMDMVTIPTEIQQLDDYGVGMNDQYYNYIDFQNKKFVRNVTKQVINGSENWRYLGDNYNTDDYICFVVWSDATKPNHIATAYNSGLILANQGFNAGFVYGTAVEKQIDMWVNPNEENSRIMLKILKTDLNTYDVSGLVEYLTANPITIIYPLANPEEYDLSHIKLDSVYRVSNMGSETLLNEYEQPAPTEILYGVDIVPQVIENASNISFIRETMKEFAYQDDINNLQQEIVNKVDKTKGEIVADTFYSRQTALDSTGSKLEIVDETGVPLKIGGMTYKSDNLLVFEDVAQTTTNGITYSVKDGIIYANGTNSSSSTIFINFNLKKELVLNGTYSNSWFVNGDGLTSDGSNQLRYHLVEGGVEFPSNSSTSTKTLTATIKVFALRVATGGTINITTKPMLVLGSTIPTEFKQGFSGLRDSAVTEIISTGENLLNLADRELDFNGVKATCVDGIITLNGTATAASSVYIHEKVLLRKKLNVGDKFIASWWFEGIFSNNGIDIMISTYDGTKYDTVGRNSMNVGETQKNVAFTIATGSYLRGVSLYIRSGTVLNNVKVKVMLVNGSTPSTEYKPYWEDVFTIPQEVVDLDGYGCGIDDEYYNYIDFENKKFVKKVQKVVLDGSSDEVYNLSTADNGNGIANFGMLFASNNLPKYIANGTIDWYVANREEQLTMQAATTTEGVYLNQENLFIRVKSTTANTIDSLRTYLASNPVEVVYTIATPTEIDLSNVKFDVIYNVSNLGSETLVNEYNNAVYTEILYGMNVIGQVSENANNISEIRKDLQGLATKKQVDELEQVVSRKADKVQGETVEESFYSRPTGSHFEIIDETGSIMKLGGMTYKSSNLLVFDDVAATVLSGIAYKVQDGVIYLTGTATAAASIKFPLSGIGSGSYYLKWEFTGTTSSGIFGYLYNVGHTTQLTILNTTSVFKRAVTLTQEAGDFTVYWQSGAVISNIALKPILVKGSTEPTIWEKGFSGLRDTAVTEIISNGANLINPSDITHIESATLQDDGSYLSSSSNAWHVIKLNAAYDAAVKADRSKNGISFKKGTYYISIKAKIVSGASCNINAIFILRENTKQVAPTWADKPSSLTSEYQEYKGLFTLDTDDKIGIGVQLDVNASSSVIQFKNIMISSVDTEYVPYWEDITEIPQEIQDLDGYGWGVNSEYYNYVDFQNKKFVKRVAKYTFTGSEYVGQATTNTSGVYRYFTGVLNNLAVGVNASNVKGALLMADLNTVSADETYLCNDGVCIDGNGRIYFFKSDIQSVSDMASYLTGKTIYYALLTPTETDISDIKLNQVYRVDNNGMETLVNEYNLSAPTEILYGVNITPQVIENSNDIASTKDDVKELKNEIETLKDMIKSLTEMVLGLI